MFNQDTLTNSLLKQNIIHEKNLAQMQIEQAYARLAFACTGLAYIYIHGIETFRQYQDIFLWVTIAYFLSTLISIPSIRHQPLSIYRILAFPLLDTFVVIFAMLMDGGLSSGIYFMLLVIIFGNNFRFGNIMLRYSQAWSLIALICLALFIDMYSSESLDYTLLGWQIMALIIIPFYIHLIGQKAERALKMQIEAEESSFHLMDKGPLPIFNFDLGDNKKPQIIYANKAMHELFQYNHTRWEKADVDIISLAEDRRELISFCQSILKDESLNQKNTAQHIYIRGQDQSGKILKLMCTAIAMRWRRDRVGVCFIHDISQRETMKEELESMHRTTYMSTLVAGIVHDFRNVLTNMIGYAEVMQFNSSNDHQRQQLESIIEAGDRGAALITHLLNLSKSNHSTINNMFTEGHGLAKPLENIIGLARLQLPKQIQLSCSIDNILPDVGISVVEIEQILLNLINNSTQAIPESGYIKIAIKNAAKHDLSKPNHPCLCIQVSDNGSGIAASDIDTIFKPFWTSRSDQGGSGLGLSMVQRIIKQNHGCITVTSIPNQETTFTIHLPPYIASPVQKTTTQITTPAHNTAKEHTLDGCHALLVDDVTDILKIHQAMLSHMNITSDLAENGQIAFDLFQDPNKHFDIMITDYKMPIMDGLTLIKKIRADDTKLPILMISAFGEDNQLQEVMKNNVTLLNKPINMEALKTAILTTIHST
ncbi:MAG: hybrid sensor histidine kinase/response regulator [Mariprofundaceae bacterium]|nr:hybrid sensor histidine kinase/response regulator [Mariprofundaceae bacterium]